MKVQELIENDEWANNPASQSLAYLYKKQASASHQFEIELLKHDVERDLSSLKDISSFGQSPSTFIRKDLHWAPRLQDQLTDSFGTSSGTLRSKFDKMINAKNEYEFAGGNYNDNR